MSRSKDMKSQSSKQRKKSDEEEAEDDMLILDSDEGALEKWVKENQNSEFVFKRVALLIDEGYDPKVAADMVAQEIKEIESGDIISEDDIEITEEK